LFLNTWSQRFAVQNFACGFPTAPAVAITSRPKAPTTDATASERSRTVGVHVLDYAVLLAIRPDERPTLARKPCEAWNSKFRRRER
jgi:hypothetical protein